MTLPRGAWNELDTGVELTPAVPDTHGMDTSGSDAGTMDTRGKDRRGPHRSKLDTRRPATDLMITCENVTRDTDTIRCLPHSLDTREMHITASDMRGNVTRVNVTRVNVTRERDTIMSVIHRPNPSGNVTRGPDSQMMVTRGNVTRERDTIRPLLCGPDTLRMHIHGSDMRANVTLGYDRRGTDTIRSIIHRPDTRENVTCENVTHGMDAIRSLLHGPDTLGPHMHGSVTRVNVTHESDTHTMVTCGNITRESDTITSLPHSPDTHEVRMRGSDTRGNVMHASPAPPVLREAPTEFVSAHAGLTLHLPCTAQAWPPAALHWRLPDGTYARPVHVHTHPRLSDIYVLPNGTLVLRHLQAPRHAGEYECVAANALSSAKRTVHVEVTPTHPRLPPSVRPRGPLATPVPHGADLTLHCHARGDPAPRVFWRLPDGRLVDAGSSSDIRVRAFPNGTLSVRPVTSRDAGEYVCMARNAVGDAHARLRVELAAGPGTSYLQPRLPVTPVTQDADPREDCTAHHRLHVPSGVLRDPDIQVARPDGSVGI
ncbi:hemicentin-1-like [Dipodomys merriami]|uniref:hemicentin-1-like n=1 Tax=Dipodomys merriami TaxID=94247 RepID=UPI003855B9FA